MLMSNSTSITVFTFPSLITYLLEQTACSLRAENASHCSLLALNLAEIFVLVNLSVNIMSGLLRC